VHVFAELRGPAWVVLDGTQFVVSWNIDPVDPLPHAGNPVTAPATGVNMQFNPGPTAKWTAFVNAHRAMSETVRWLDLGNTVPIVPLVVHASSGGTACGGYYYPPSSTGNQWPGGGLLFYEGHINCIPGFRPEANAAYSTYVAREYGHFVARNLMGIEITHATQAFHEGFGDTLALLLYDTEFFAEDNFGCGEDSRWPRNPDPAKKAVFPRCDDSTGNCSTSYSGIQHCRGELLAALWRDLDQELGNTAVRELFLDWIMIAQAPTFDGCPGSSPPEGPDQAADDGTLVDVLAAAGNNSPHIATICDVFEGRLIEHPGPAPHPCQDSAGWYCYADCDSSAILDFWDFLCFQNAFGAGDSYADCDGDGGPTFFDFLCFQNEFIKGCP
jgi:hypothetical protein